MVARAGGYCGAEFMGDRGVMQGDSLYPTIFNVVVDAVVKNWVSVMVEVSEERGGRRQEGIHHNALFYTDDGMVALSDLQWLQGSFITLVGLFNRVGLWNNFWKTVSMVCRLCQAAGTQLEAAYGRWVTGEGPSYWEWQRGRVQCKECGEEMALGSLAGHMQTQHGRSAEGRRSWETMYPGEDPRTYRMKLPTAGDCVIARWRDVRDARRRGRRCGYTFSTGISGIMW